jgi:dTDP-L-rhamnose 4-epimerase
MKKNILITGGAGFIGSHLSLELLKNGHKVRVLDNLSPQIHGTNPSKSPLYRSIKNKVNFICGDVTNESDLKEALQDVDTVVHLAAETGTGQSMYAIKHYSDVNVGGTALLLDLISSHNLPIKRIVVASSRAVYGEGKYICQDHGDVYPTARAVLDLSKGDFEPHCPQCNKPTVMTATDEKTPVNPLSVYGITKLNQEQMVLTVGSSLGISAIAFRYQNVYGPGQSLSNPYTGILSIFSTRMRNGNNINIFEDGKESRDFVYIDDVVAATIAGIESPKKIVDVFNVGSGDAINVINVTENLQKLLNTQVPIVISGQFRVGDIRHNLADLTHIKTELGYKPAYNFSQGLSMFVEWVKREKIQNDRYDESLTELKVKGLLSE